MAKISPEPQKSPIIDTTLLFEFLLWRFYEETSGDGEEPGPPPAYSYQYLREPETRRAFLWYISKAKPIETSPHVIAEIHGLAKSRVGMKHARLGAFWKFAQGELTQLRSAECFVPLEQMNTNDLQFFGPADTSLLQRARTSGKVLLSGEQALKQGKGCQDSDFVACARSLDEAAILNGQLLSLGCSRTRARSIGESNFGHNRDSRLLEAAATRDAVIPGVGMAVL